MDAVGKTIFHISFKLLNPVSVTVAFVEFVSAKGNQINK
jgi:hypothetical protein